MKLPSELFCWLKALRLIKNSPDFQALADYQDLDPHDQKEIEYGLTVLKLADKICAIKKIEYLKLGAEHAVPIFTKAKMIINWRTGFNLLSKLGLGLEPELLNLIINGDTSIVIDVMTLIYKKFGKKVDLAEHDEAATLKALGLSESRVGHPPSAQHSISEMQSANRQDDSLNRGDGNTLVPLKIPRAQSSIALRQGMSAKSRSVIESVKNDSQYLKANLPTLNQTTLSRNYSMAGSKLNLADFKLSVSSQLIPLDINQIELHQPRAEDIDHLFQYLLVTSASAFRMKVSTVLPLFSGGGKILANMIVKGVRYEGFTTIVDWFTRLKADVPRIFDMILTDRSWSTLKLFLTTIKPGLISKSTEVSECALSILTKLCLMQKDRNLLSPT